MEYLLKNGKRLIVRDPKPEDAEQIIHVLKTADCETRFLARNPGEFQVTADQEKEVIANVLSGNARTWFVPEYEGKVVGQCSVGIVRNNERYLHRASVAFVLLKEYWGLGIGGKMMEECIDWCLAHDVAQMELDVVKDNERAIKMYRDFGFEIVGTIPNALRYPDGTCADEFLMVKQIKRAEKSDIEKLVDELREGKEVF